MTTMTTPTSLQSLAQRISQYFEAEPPSASVPTPLWELFQEAHRMGITDIFVECQTPASPSSVILRANPFVRHPISWTEEQRAAWYDVSSGPADYHFPDLLTCATRNLSPRMRCRKAAACTSLDMPLSFRVLMD